MLDKASPIPLYYQLQEVIRDRVESGEWRAGQQVPPEYELCKEFNLSRGTVRQALASLVREGLLHRRRGRGSFITTPRISQDTLGIAGSFMSCVYETTGKQFSSRLISIGTINARSPLTEKLEVVEATEVIETREVILMDGRPHFLVVTHVRKDQFPGLEEADLGDGSVSDLLREQYGIQVSRAEGWLEPLLISTHDAVLLEAREGAPAMVFDRIHYAADGKPLMVTRHTVHGELGRLTFTSNETLTKSLKTPLTQHPYAGNGGVNNCEPIDLATPALLPGKQVPERAPSVPPGD